MANKIADIYELSPLQQGMLFHAASDPESTAYVDQFSCRLEGDVNHEALEHAWRDLVERHAVFRTSFHWKDLEKPLQVVHRETSLWWQVLDWQHLSESDQRNEWQDYLLADRKAGFDTEKAPLMRLSLIRLGNGSHYFCWSHHHLLLDGWCLSLLLGELFQAYNCRLAEKAFRLPKPPPYRNYIAWLQEQPEDAAERFWREDIPSGFSGGSLSRGASIAFPISVGEGREFGETKVYLDSHLVSAIKALAVRCGVTTQAVFQTAWSLLLSRYLGEPEVVVGLTVSGRPPELLGVDRMVGNFINTLPVFDCIDSSESLADWMKRRQAAQAERDRFAYTSLGDIRKWCGISGDQPLFESVLVFQNYPLDESLAGGCDEFRILEPSVYDETDVPLTLQVNPHSEWSVEMHFSRRLFDQVFVERALRHLLVLLRQMAADCEQPVGNYAVVVDEERCQIMESFKGPVKSLPPGETLVTMVERSAATTPDHIAFRYRDRSLTFAALNCGANRLAKRWMEEYCLSVGDVVAIVLERSDVSAMAILALWKCGAIYAPIDLRFPAQRIRTYLENSKARLVVAEHEDLGIEAMVEATETTVVYLDEVKRHIEGGDSGNVALTIDHDALAYLIFTSGSTGTPKAALNHHGGLLNHTLATINELQIDDATVVAQTAAPCFDISIWQYWTAPAVGGTTIVYQDDLVADPERLVKALDADGVTIVQLVPTHLNSVLDSAIVQSEPDVLSRLRLMNASGEALKLALVERWFERFPKIPMVNAYGPAEASDDVTFHVMTSSPEREPVPIGKAVENFRIYIVDGDMNLCPIGIKGEICVSGLGVGLGYLNDEARTEASFIEDPFVSERGVRLYRTGDIGSYLRDGTLMYFGRNDHQVKIRGHRIELGEIESCLAQIEGLSDAVVAVHRPEGRSPFLCGYVVYRESARPSLDAIKIELARRLPDYMVPATFVVLDALPLLQNGKVNRHVLPVPDSSTDGARVRGGAPRNEKERMLVDIWRQCLGVSDLGIHDHFFELGGDSILCMQAISLAARQNIQLVPRQIFQYPTVAELGSEVQIRETSKLSQEKVSGAIPLTPIQREFFELHGKRPHHYNQSILLETPPDMNPAVVSEVISVLVERHECLRLSFQERGGEWFQEASSTVRSRELRRVSCEGLSDPDFERRLSEAVEKVQSGLNLSKGPILDLLWMDRGAQRPGRLLVVVHHAAIDGVSWRVLMEEFVTGYGQRYRGDSIALPHKSSSFKAHAESLQKYARSESLEQEEVHWLKTLPEDVRSLSGDLRSSLTRGPYSESKQIEIALSRESTERFVRLAARDPDSGAMSILLSAFVVALHRCAGLSQVTIDLEGHGREGLDAGLDLTRTVGWLTSKYPVRFELGENVLDEGNWERLLGVVRARLQGVPNGGRGFGVARYFSPRAEVRQALQARADVPLLFNYHGNTDAALPSGVPWRWASESSGREIAPSLCREYDLEVNALITGGQLLVHWDCGPEYEALVQQLADHYSEILEQIMEVGERTLSLGTAALVQSPGECDPAIVEQLFKAEGLSAESDGAAFVEDVYPVAPTQLGILFHCLSEPESDTYFNQLECVIEGCLALNLFQEAWERVVAWHPELRSSFHWVGVESPVQTIDTRRDLEWVNLDWQVIPADERVQRWTTLLREDRKRGFRLSQRSLMRFALVQEGSERWRFLWSQHHLLLDGWSSAIVLNEVFAGYHALLKGEEVVLNRPPHFRENVLWLQGRDASEDERFWKERLSGFDMASPLPTGGPTLRALPEQMEDRSFGSVMRTVPRETFESLVNRTRKWGVTLNTVAQGLWAILLSRYNGGSEDVVHGTVFSGRSPLMEGSDEMIGVFINSLPVRCRPQKSANLRSWLKELQMELAELDFVSIVALSDVIRWSDVPAGQALFESLLIFENYPVESTLREGSDALRVHSVQSHEPNNFPITLIVSPGKQLEVKVMFDQSLYDPADAERILGHYLTLVNGLLADNVTTIGDLDILTESEQTLLLSEWNHTDREWGKGETVLELFVEQVRRRPSGIAVQIGELGRTYQSLYDGALSLAGVFASFAPLVQEDRVAVLLHRSDRMVESILGIWMCGAAYVPIDPDYPADRVRLILERCDPKLVVTDTDAVKALPSDYSAKGGRVVMIDQEEDSVGGSDALFAGRPLEKNGLAYIIFTSGSTGIPKGAMLQHDGMLNHIRGMIHDLDLDETSRVAQTASHCFDISVWQFFAGLIIGGTTVIYPNGVVADIEGLVTRIRRDRVNAVQLVPSYLAVLIERMESMPQLEPFPDLNCMVTIGEALKPEVVKRWFRLFPGINLMNAYGPTEASDSVTHYTMSSMPGFRSIPIGYPVPNLRIYVLDPDRRLCPVGTKGEIHIGGLGVGRGYFRDQERTAEAFVEDPFSPDGKGVLYKTGDIGLLAGDGTILFLGRQDSQVKIRGNRIELGEIESALLTFPGVEDAVVLARDDAAGVTRLYAYVVQGNRESDQSAAMRETLALHLPRYMIPDRWLFLEGLPRLPNGKVNRNALRRLDVPEEEPSHVEESLSELDASLLEMFQRLFGNTNLSLASNFFEAGGTSLLAIRAVSQIQREFGAKLELVDLLASESLREVSKRVVGIRVDAKESRIVPTPDSEDYPVSYAQRRILLACQTEDSSVAYNMGGVFEVRGHLDIARFEDACRRLIERHEILRTTFLWRAGELRQRVVSAADLETSFELFEKSASLSPECAEREAMEQLEQSYDLEKGPLFKVRMWGLGKDRYILMLGLHHSIGDGWSLGVILGDLLRFYQSRDLLPLGFQYRDYARWHRAELSGALLEGAKNYWKQRLSNPPPLATLPPDVETVSRNDVGGAQVVLDLDQALSRKIGARAKALNMSRFSLVLGAIYVLMCRYTNQDDLILGFQTAGREHNSMDEQVGCYTNTVALRCRLHEDMSLRSAVESVAGSLRQDYQYQSYPYDLLLEEMGGGNKPLFDIHVDSAVADDGFMKQWEEMGVAVAPLGEELPLAKYSLSLMVHEGDEAISIRMIYRTAFYMKKSIEAFRSRLLTVLQSIVDNPDQKISAVNLVGASSRTEAKQKKVRVKFKL